MATEYELRNVYILEYQSILKQIAFFGLKYPDSKEGYNALIDVAEDIKQRAEAAGCTSLAPLPARK
jgi:hypothetical protein